MSHLIRQSWNVLRHVPGGKRVFSELVGQAAPYTGTIGARVLELDEGYCKVELRDRRAVRNHLDSIHAIALMNLGEVCTGLALIYGMPGEARGILKGLSMEYIKKGRGTLTAECRTPIPDTRTRNEIEIEGEIRDTSGDLVARARALWVVGPGKR